MNYRVKMSAEQLRAVAEWAARGDGFADILLDDGDDDRILVGQGDERAAFNTEGARCCEQCGALDGEELVGDCCYSCGLGCEPEPFEGGDGTEPGPAGGGDEGAEAKGGVA
jgi:hypothetical protein